MPVAHRLFDVPSPFFFVLSFILVPSLFLIPSASQPQGRVASNSWLDLGSTDLSLLSVVLDWLVGPG